MNYHEPVYRGGYGLKSRDDYRKFQSENEEKSNKNINSKICGTVGAIYEGLKKTGLDYKDREQSGAKKKNEHLASNAIEDEVLEQVAFMWSKLDGEFH